MRPAPVARSTSVPPKRLVLGGEIAPGRIAVSLFPFEENLPASHRAREARPSWTRRRARSPLSAPASSPRTASRGGTRPSFLPPKPALRRPPSSSTPRAASSALDPATGAQTVLLGRRQVRSVRVTTPARREARRVLEIEAEAVRALADDLDEGFDRAVEAMKSTSGRVVVTGIGKSGIVGQKIAATLASTGTAAFFLHPTEAIHGDLGMILKGDVVLALSHSGETEEVVALLPARQAARRDARRPDGQPRLDAREGRGRRRPLGHPRGGLPAQPRPDGLHDRPARDGRRPRDGALGREGVSARGLRRAAPRREAREAVPQGLRPDAHRETPCRAVRTDAPMKDVVYEMSRKRLGITAVVDVEGKLAGVVSDGDLRRLLEKYGPKMMERPAGDAMSRSPKTIARAPSPPRPSSGWRSGRSRPSSSSTPDGRPAGILHLHDLWGVESI